MIPFHDNTLLFKFLYMRQTFSLFAQIYFIGNTEARGGRMVGVADTPYSFNPILQFFPSDLCFLLFVLQE
jgi:hypothetical protein